MKRLVANNKIIAILLVILNLCNLLHAQETDSAYVAGLSNIKRDKIIELALNDDIFFCINILTPGYEGKAIVENHELIDYHRKNNMGFSYEEWAKNLLIAGDTLLLLGDELTYHKVDSIIQWDEKKKDKLLTQFLKKNNVYHINYNVIARLFEWNILIAETEYHSGPTLERFNYKRMLKISQGDVMNTLLNQSLMMFMDSLDEKNIVYLVANYYPYNFKFDNYFIDNSKVKFFTSKNPDNPKYWKRGVRLVRLYYMDLKDDKFVLGLDESIIEKKRGEKIRYFRTVQKDIQFTYSYKLDELEWKLEKIKKIL